MIVVVQRVTNAEVNITEPHHHESIKHGLVVLLGIEMNDTLESAKWLAKKIANLRIFKDDNDKLNRSVININGEILAISQFTLAGDCKKGNRPSFIHAAPPEEANSLYEQFVEELQTTHHIRTKTGIFGAMMDVTLTNQGPVTLILRHPC